MIQFFGLLEIVQNYSIQILIVLGCTYIFFGLDDLFIDLIAFLYRLKPKSLSENELKSILSLREKNIAIMVPAWKEGEIIDRMLIGNIERIKYTNYHFFIGIYPNDPLSVEKLTKLNQKYPNIHGVVNYKPGPTSKGQMLNYAVQKILIFERHNNIKFDAIHMQDAEDVIHPLALKLINWQLETNDFIQIPVFSLEVKLKQLVAGTYMDEFAEFHTKDLFVRKFLNAAIPSAGVGTTLSKRLIETFHKNKIPLYNEHSLTEDYELGNQAHKQNLKSTFACYYTGSGKTKDFIATREFFPKNANRSIRQKTRWTVGISLQGWRNLGWFGSLGNRYFLFRDRKAIPANIFSLLGYPFFIIVLTTDLIIADDIRIYDRVSIATLIVAINFLLMFNRFVQRSVCSYRVYGLKGILFVFIRWPISNYINGLASIKALYQDINSRIRKVSIAWAKTEHELPEIFQKGLDSPVEKSPDAQA